MKMLSEYLLQESFVGSAFQNSVSYSKKDFRDWMRMAQTQYADEIFMVEPKDDTNLVCIYKRDAGSNLQHIATYNKSKQILTCDDTSLFGNE